MDNNKFEGTLNGTIGNWEGSRSALSAKFYALGVGGIAGMADGRVPPTPPAPPVMTNPLLDIVIDDEDGETAKRRGDSCCGRLAAWNAPAQTPLSKIKIGEAMRMV